MNDAVFAIPPLSDRTSPAVAGLGRFSLLVLAAVACVAMLVSNLLWRELYTGDEGFYAVTAQNMLQSPTYWLRPSYFPAGDFAIDHGGFAHPPFNSYFYAVSLWLARGSLAGPEVLNVLALAALLFVTYRLVALFDRLSAAFAVLLLATSPAILASYSFLEAEPLMTTFGVAGVYCCLRAGFARGQRLWLFLGGLCLGFAFALKLWLCGPLVVAAGIALLVRARESHIKWTAIASGLALFVLGGVLPAGLHLAAIAWYHPEDLRFWLNDIYFGLFTRSGISGAKLGGTDTPAAWTHPVWYYGAAVYREHFFLLPIILYGALSMLRDPSLRGRLLAVIAVGLLGLVPLSLMKVKEPLYVLACVIFLYALAGTCLAALTRRLESGRGLDRGSLFLGSAWTIGLGLAVLGAYFLGIKPDDITPTFAWSHSLVMGGVLAIVFWAHRKQTGAGFRVVIYTAAAVAIATAFVLTAKNRQPRDQMIARLVQPYVQDNRPETLSIVASNFKGYQVYLYQRGCYWHELALDAAPEALLGSAPFATVRAFVLSPYDLQRPEIRPWLQWLEANTVDKTAELDKQLRAVTGFRVFVRGVAGTQR